jgi:signal transduction histidine kinase
MNPDELTPPPAIDPDLPDRKLASRHQEAFLRLGHKLNSATTAEQAGHIIIEIADELIGFDACMFGLYSPAENMIHGLVGYDVLDGRRVRMPNPYTGIASPRIHRALRHGGQLILRQNAEEECQDSNPFGDKARPSASILDVPIREAGKVIGLLTIQSYQYNAYSPPDLKMLEALADYCGGALERIRAQEALLETGRIFRGELEQRVQERTTALKDANQQLEAFCYSVSHDLRAPLRAMRGYTQILLQDYPGRLDAAGEKFLRRISISAETMDRLINDLLEYSRISRMELQLGAVAMEEVLQSVLGELRNDIQSKSAAIEIVSPLPEVLGHRRILQQVFLNLTSNALKYVTGRPEIQIRAEPRATSVRILVRDNGIGVAPEYHERIFRVFERLHAAETYPGTGVGLAIVQKGVERMNGRVGVESAGAQGSTFWVELPCHG